MKVNVGSIDRIIRIILGLGIIGAGIYFQSWFGLVGLVPLFTAVFRWCPIYLPFGISSCAKPK